MHLFKPIEYKTPRTNSKVNDGLWMILTCQERFISCNKYTMLVGAVDHGRACACGEAEGTWEISIPSLSFALNLKLLLRKNKMRSEKN